MNCIAAIDFSINSTCLSILHNGKYIWHHFGREKNSYFDLSCNSFVQTILPKREKGKDYCTTERMKIMDSRGLCTQILTFLNKYEVSHVAFEGHSFNSKGNSLLELVSYQFLLRNMVASGLGINESRMFFYSPITVKAFAGGTKFKKKEMLQRFLEVDDPVLKNNEVYLKIKSSGDSVMKGDEVAKPIDDLVDSYWILKKLEQDV